MSYTVSELKQKLDEKIGSLGVSPKFKENPAYYYILGQVKDYFIRNMNMGDLLEHIYVDEKNGKISFQCSDSDCPNIKYSVTISSPDTNTFKCVKMQEDSRIDEKRAFEVEATIDSYNFITVCQYGALMYRPKDDNDRNFSYNREKQYYTADGIMRDRELLIFDSFHLSGYDNKTKATELLTVPEHSYGDYQNYKYRCLTTREQFDTARVEVDDKSTNSRYSASMPLRPSYMDLIIAGNGLSKKVYIPPLSKEEIEHKLNTVGDPKAREALRKMAEGRETYAYDSNMDDRFVYEGFSQTDGITR